MKAKCLVVCVIFGVALGLASCDWFVGPSPATLGIAPLAGAVHTLVAVVGQGFGASQGDGAVTFDGVEAAVQTWGETNIVVRVPVLATAAGERIATVRVLRSGIGIGEGLFTVLRGVLFETGRDGSSEIYVMNPDGSQQMNLTNNPASDSQPVWSPDGTRIAFVSRRDGDSEIYVMGADGSSPMNLSAHPDSDYFPVWSPNGARIAFMTSRESIGPILDATPKIIIPFNVEIFVMNGDGTGQTNLTDDPAWDGYPSWSPDGDHIVFETDRDRDDGLIILGLVLDDLEKEIYVMDADGTDPTRLSNSPGDDAFPSWSPDGSRIAFQSYRDDDWNIYTMNPDGTGQTRMTDHGEDDTFPTWSPDGDWITFQSTRDGNAEIYRISDSGTSETRLTASSDWDWGASWSLDGSEIVFQSSRDGDPEIYRMNADGSSPTRLTNDPDWDLHPFWGTFGWMPPV